MRITVDRNMCGVWAPACEECFSAFLRHNNVLDRACFTDVSEDGSEDVTVVIRSGKYSATLKITPENREAVASEGWRAFTDLPDEAFEIQPPHGEDIRNANQKA